MSRRGRFYHAAAVAWALSIVPALLWWQESVLFVIVASVWANAVAGFAAAEAADDRTVLDRLDRIDAQQHEHAELLADLAAACRELAHALDPGGRMAPTTPSPCRIVLYRLSAQDADAINRRRQDARATAQEAAKARAGMPADPGVLLVNDREHSGYVAHTGNDVREGDEFPAVIIRVWGTGDNPPVNLHVLLDGNDTLWATSVKCGDGPREYAWPARS